MEEIIIEFMSGPKDGDTLTFETMLDSGKPAQITIGRREGCDVCLSYDSQVSREHALLLYDGSRFWLEDSSSTNGTFLGEDRIDGRVELAAGRLFRVGRTWLRVEQMPSPTGDDDLPF